ITFSCFASENTAETAAGEHPFFVIAFGKTEGNEAYARVADEPFVVAVNQELLGKIWTDPLQWQELAIFKFKPNDIHRLSRVMAEEETVVRQGTKGWQWTKGTGTIDPNSVDSLLNSFSSLRAVRWVGATLPAHGFDKPAAVLSFTTSPDDKAQHKLTIGGQTPDGMWFAKVEGRDGTFVLSDAEVNTFKQSLLKPANASPSPSQSATPSPTPAG